MRQLLFLIIILLSVSCGDDDLSTSNDVEINEVLENPTCTSTPPIHGTSAEVPGSQLSTTVISSSLSVGQYNICTEEEITLEASTEALLSDFMMDLPLGAFVTASSLQNGTPQLIQTYNHRPKISSILTGISPSSVQATDDSFSAVQEAINDLKNQLPDGQEYDPIFEIKNIEYVNSVREMEAKLGVHGKFLFGNFESSFEYNSSVERSSLMVVLGQQRMKFVADLPENYSFLDVSGISPETDCPVMLKSVTMGGLHVLLFTANNSSADFRTDLKAAANGLVTKGGIELTVEQQAALDQTSISSFTLGGINSYVFNDELPTNTDFQSYVVEGNKFDNHRIGVPLSYEFVYLDGTPFRSIAIDQLTRQSCELATIYTDHPHTYGGPHQGGSLEVEVDLSDSPYKVITGIGATVAEADDNFITMEVQYRELYANATLGPRMFAYNEGDGDHHDLETVWEASDGRVLVTMGGGVNTGFFNTLKVITARPVLNEETGKIELVDFETEYFGEHPYENYVEAFCEPVNSSMQQVVRGIGMSCYNWGVHTLKLSISTLD